MKIEILGTGCAKCNQLEKNTRLAIEQTKGVHSVNKIDDLQIIMDYGVTSTPAMVIDGKVKSTGKVLGLYDIVEILNNCEELSS